MSKRNPLPPALGLIAGFIAASLTVIVPIGNLLGITFGVVMAVYFWFFSPARSIQRALGFVGVSTAAYTVAVFVTIFSGEYIPHEIKDFAFIAGYPPLSFFLGGTVGAFLVLLAAVLFFSTETNLPELLLKTFLLALVGGALGVLGWAAGHLVGDRILSALGKEQFLNNAGKDDAGYYCSIFLVWQTGMGAVIGLMFRQAELRSPLPSNDDAPIPPAPSSIWIARYCLLAPTLLLLTFYLVSTLHHFVH
jgi:hypothetical protein